MQVRFGRPPLPREHGAWAMLLTPPLAALLAEGPDPRGILAIAGWFAGYALRGPAEVLLGRGASGRAGMAHGDPRVARFWLVCFGAIAALCLAPLVVSEPRLLGLLAGAAALLLLVFWLAQHGETRALLNGCLAVAGLMAGGPLYYVAATGQVDARAWALTYACSAFFLGSVFRVKAVARERRHAPFRWLSAALHLAFMLLPALAAAAGWAPPLLWLPLLPPALWAIYGAWRAGRGPAANLGRVGWSEVALTLLFALLLIMALRA